MTSELRNPQSEP